MTVIETHTVGGSTRDSVFDGRLEWTSACPLSHLIPGRGVAVLLRGGEQVALFLLDDGTCAQWATSIRSAAPR